MIFTPMTKYVDERADLIIPAQIDPNILKIREAAGGCCTECRGMARADFFLTKMFFHQ